MKSNKSIKVNIFKDKQDMNTAKLINSLPGLCFFILIFANKLINSDILLFTSLFFTIVGLILIAFPFYLNSLVVVEKDRIRLEGKLNINIELKDIDIIEFELRQDDFEYNYIKCKIISKDETFKTFLLTRHLFAGKKKQMEKFLGYLSYVKFESDKIKFID
ncbi:hypothetical protein ACFSR6_03920 [Pedobacter vanadiisoli]|uniref:PH (Pleckstrin Homology) domain-containing protein n=1 Tax=Pedobacter vanadiisoli TaxID=1761975 RepID=A0ABW5MEM3_9SPHI